MLQVTTTSRSKLCRSTTEKDALTPLPSLDTGKEEDCFNEHDGPFPADTGMLEDHVVDNRDIEDREDGDEARHDGPEQKLVAPDIVHPLGEVLFGSGLHAEK